MIFVISLVSFLFFWERFTVNDDYVFITPDPLKIRFVKPWVLTKKKTNKKKQIKKKQTNKDNVSF